MTELEAALCIANTLYVNMADAKKRLELCTRVDYDTCLMEYRALRKAYLDALDQLYAVQQRIHDEREGEG